MISVICPVYNEEKYIGKVLDFFIKAAPRAKEIILVDGGSTDNTRQVVRYWQEQYEGIRLLDNPNRYVPFALNKAIAAANGEVIIRLDAHSEYAPDYFEKVLEAFRKSAAPIVGGPIRAGGSTDFQKAVSYATATVFGIGNSGFHFEGYEGYSDTVYLGAWKRNVFNQIGLFDEAMLRNQDDEFHYRACKSGLKIYQDPAIRSLYFPRTSYKKLFRQYYEYGLFKPLVLKKVKRGFRWRHIIPSCFVLYVFSLPLVFAYPGWAVFLLVYLLLDIFFVLRSKRSGTVMVHILLVYPILHLAYGMGFIGGLKKIL
ncbi:glycosyltransferase family 2 protein [Flavitalea sp. BT771]|uniref:glycosyltransferase family 2 protein n=1 Tax=Flavitalea sp. BT771 TaxID=3063329 RepID=UPI0026E40D4C|nr:glycosyltransferase family 2 protein [Flavitalea sp. BT771]MDO6429403.1 glycosyltransferase family 2 protein [Flavitalea sp. BT771]MDV6218469.1 glycosyltransferase family 2 protein [Flavitalea sp. BT771]